MKLLALDAATEACSVALKIGDDVITRFEVCPQQHSQKLLPFVDALLAEAGIGLNQLDAIAFGQGPGSFTGVRIGVAITQGLAFGADLPVIGVSNLATMAQEAVNRLGAKTVLSAIDARMSEIYVAAYEVENDLVKLVGSEQVVKPSAYEVPLSLITKDVHAVGTGWTTYREALNNACATTESDIELPKAEFMLPLAEQSLNAGNGVIAELAQPNYVRDEVTWQKLPGR
jgi:tRNA threonylcarbamoyladenosine biosynthesis protein TsaB